MGGKSGNFEQTQDHAQERKKHQGLTQQCRWHSDSDGDKRRKFLQIPPFKYPQNAGPDFFLGETDKKSPQIVTNNSGNRILLLQKCHTVCVSHACQGVPLDCIRLLRLNCACGCVFLIKYSGGSAEGQTFFFNFPQCSRHFLQRHPFPP